MVLSAANASAANTLTGHKTAVDEMYRADSRKEFTGQSPNLAWTRGGGGGLALSPSPGANRGDRPRRSKQAAYSGVYTSPAIEAAFAFTEMIPSWNIQLDEACQGYRVYMRVAGKRGKWSEWLYFGGGGTLAQPDKARALRQSAEWGRVQTDYIVLRRPAARFQYRVELASNANVRPAGRHRVLLKRFFVSYSNTEGNADLFEIYATGKSEPGEGWARDLQLPYRSQLWVDDERLRGQICCPTSLAMILEKNGHDDPTTVVASKVFDPETRIYGNWSRTAQVGSTYGLEAWITRFRRHDDVKRAMAAGLPVMASIRFRDGDLSGARYKSTNGHLILIRGMKENGDYIVNDPYNPGPDGGEVTYEKDDLEKVWFDKGGVGIVFRKPVQGTP